jgi:hypothetical protein
MGTVTTFITPVLYDDEYIAVLDTSLYEYAKERGAWFEYGKVKIGGGYYFHGYSKEASEGFYTWLELAPFLNRDIDTRCVWITDEGDFGLRE